MSRKNPIVSVIYSVPITLQSPFLSFFAYTAQATFLRPPPVGSRFRIYGHLRVFVEIPITWL